MMLTLIISANGGCAVAALGLATVVVFLVGAIVIVVFGMSSCWKWMAVMRIMGC